ncbi:MAG: MBL fold metallo-hydrolase [Chloroflexi bacterium]|nr:MBL fold metallo-hydrolase [Chloroflexota bacterium]
MENKSPASETITFLGTGGARFMIVSQILASGGLWLNLNGTEILIDPGPGCIVQATKRKFQAERLSAIILSHRHLDHSADVNIMVEAMTQSGFKQHGRLFAPADALETEPVIFSYLKNYLDGVEILREGKSYSIGNVSFTTPVRHIHLVETYGMVFRTDKHTFSYIADTRYFAGLCQHYGGELLIINLVFLEPRPPSYSLQLPGDHLSVPDVEQIIGALKPRVVILTHFGLSVWRAKPWQVAQRLSEKTGVKVIAAWDGMKFDLTELESI